MAEQNPTPPTVCVVCGELVSAEDAVAVPEHHEAGEIISTLVRHSTCALPSADAG